MSAPPPQRAVPTLTEVVDWPDADASIEPLPAESPAPAPPITEDQLTERVLRDLQHQIDPMLDYRLRELLTPLLARAADGLVRDVRQQLALTLRDVVARAVAQEVSRHRAG